jgi:hypothetical protein
MKVRVFENFIFLKVTFQLKFWFDLVDRERPIPFYDKSCDQSFEREENHRF